MQRRADQTGGGVQQHTRVGVQSKDEFAALQRLHVPLERQERGVAAPHGAGELGDCAALALPAGIRLHGGAELARAHRQHNSAAEPAVEPPHLPHHRRYIGGVLRHLREVRLLEIGQQANLHRPLPVGVIQVGEVPGGLRRPVGGRQKRGHNDCRASLLRHYALQLQARERFGNDAFHAEIFDDRT